MIAITGSSIASGVNYGFGGLWKNDGILNYTATESGIDLFVQFMNIDFQNTGTINFLAPNDRVTARISGTFLHAGDITIFAKNDIELWSEGDWSNQGYIVVNSETDAALIGRDQSNGLNENRGWIDAQGKTKPFKTRPKPWITTAPFYLMKMPVSTMGQMEWILLLLLLLRNIQTI